MKITIGNQEVVCEEMSMTIDGVTYDAVENVHCPKCRAIAAVPDAKSPVGYRRVSTVGCIFIKDWRVLVACSECLHEFWPGQGKVP